ncbi:hypothetical protein RvY_18256-2 [Ramazzottius varieornatus]|uniref:Protein kinase domain-containing protein n=1 Tax=Ramazzottius varieornatus TaxID=947166 RepID=A0A1D1W574_RAMVA|nr:hypothetical protein RvY_18256-2 [Ramazzottius varieornatus]
MGEFLRSALDYIGAAANNSAGPKDDTDLVGNIVEIEKRKYRVKRLLAEGGFAYVYLVQDAENGKEYALKRLLAHDEEAAKNVKQEIKFLKKLNGHPNIIEYIAAALCRRGDNSNVEEYLILTEFCNGGQVIDLIKKKEVSLTVADVLTVFYQACKAVQHMHKQTPPIIHRDLKVENLLLGQDGKVKLCDFGSATTVTHAPDMTWDSRRRNQVEDEMTKNTTPMYRAPEMLDLYSNAAINEKLDIWALGCVLYALCYQVHPFEDSAKLRIINAKYTFPPSRTYDIFNDLISRLLTIDPKERPSINSLLEDLASMADAFNVDTNKALTVKMPSPVLDNHPTGAIGHRPSATATQGDGVTPLSTHSSQGGLFGNVGSGLLGNIVKGGKSIVKNIQQTAAMVKEELNAPSRPQPQSQSAHQGRQRPDKFTSYLDEAAVAVAQPPRRNSGQNERVTREREGRSEERGRRNEAPPRPQPPRSPRTPLRNDHDDGTVYPGRGDKPSRPPRPPSLSPSLQDIPLPLEPLKSPEDDLLGLSNTNVSIFFLNTFISEKIQQK